MNIKDILEEAFELLEEIHTTCKCTCDEAYTSRNLTDPQCCYHNYIYEDWTERYVKIKQELENLES